MLYRGDLIRVMKVTRSASQCAFDVGFLLAAKIVDDNMAIAVRQALPRIDVRPAARTARST